MTERTTDFDPRPQMRSALDQTEQQVEALADDDLSRATPCAAYDVQTLIAHLVAVLRKLATVGRGGPMSAVSDPAVDLTGLLLEEFRRARTDLEDVWADDAALDRDHTLVWGVLTGRELLDAYAHEFTVHAWDLARATGREQDLDPVLAEAGLDWFARNVSPDDRSDDGPFGPVVEVSADADVHTRLAGFVGRSSEWIHQEPSAHPASGPSSAVR